MMLLDLAPVLPAPSLGVPAPLSRLETLAYNLRWTWRRETLGLFQRVKPGPWPNDCSPSQALREVVDWSPLLEDKEFIVAVDSEAKSLAGYLESEDKAWHGRTGRSNGTGLTAYFCAEYCFHQSMNQYAGGLGILAGDHVKEASDLGTPFVAIGLLYRRGFFHQIIDFSGRQEAYYPTYSPEDLLVQRVAAPGTQTPLTLELPLPGRTLKVAVWRLAVGRTPVILLDTDVESNSLPDRQITSQLYTGGREMRVLQEFVLGVGGVRALDALGIEPTCHHLNEGHSAFLLLERLTQKIQKGASLEEARKEVAKSAILTIHTPIPEGNERFGAEDVASLITPLLERSGVKAKDILSKGLGADKDPHIFDMTAFALRHTRMANGVSLLHGKTADKTWRSTTKQQVIGITNGVHMPTWLGPSMKSLYAAASVSLDSETSLGIDDSSDRPAWQGAAKLDDTELWKAHLEQKAALLDWAKDRLYRHHARLGEGVTELQFLIDSFDPDALLIGFARRFATYKRAGLMFTDIRRITKLMNAKGRKVQVLFAGKSHPHDRGGQAVIEKVYKATQSPKLKGKVFLLEDYDMETGMNLVQGVDLWLNNPRRPLEASGTSGMKAAANGIPNASILDGWWDEACLDGKNGWAIGDRKLAATDKEQDAKDAESLYRVLEEKVIPAFFDRGADGVPHKWTALMKEAIATSLYSFSTARMLRDYVDVMYKG